jgi:type VI secretion system protein ImpA
MRLPVLDDLVAPITADQPCGPNLEYSPLFAALEVALAGRPERQVGTFIEPAEAPNWARVQELAADLFRYTRDLRIAIAWTRALTATDGIEGAALGLNLIARLLTTWPRDVHPVIEPDEDPPPTRWWILASLGLPGALLHDLSGPKFELQPPTATVATQMNDALITIREVLSNTASGEALPEWWRSLKVRDDSAAIRLLPAAKPDGADATVGSSDDAALLERVCGVIDRAGIDPSSIRRRAQRIRMEQFLDLVLAVAPAHREHAAAFLQPLGAQTGRRSGEREEP